MLSKWISGIILSLFSLQALAAQAPQFWNLPQNQNTPNESPSQIKQGLLYTLAANYDESINFQPGLNLYQVAGQLTDLFGTHGSELCAPIAITHGFTYLKYPAQFPLLPTIPDVDGDGTADTYQDKIRYFFSHCHTGKEDGTHYSDALSCMKEYLQSSSYKPYVYMVGAHSVEAPPGVPLETMKHVLNVTDIRTYVGNHLMVIMAIGWYSLDAATNTYTRVGGHFFNVYGYDYSQVWHDGQIILKVVNSWIDYSQRKPVDMFDTVTMTKLPAEGAHYPSETGYELTGPGFQFTQKAFVEDIFVVLPLK